MLVEHEASSVFDAAREVTLSLDNVRLTDSDHRLLKAMSRALLQTGPIPLKADGPFGSGLAAITKVMSDLHWKLATKSFSTPGRASQYAKIANRVDGLSARMRRPSWKLGEFAGAANQPCLADFIDPGHQLT
jgi:hypothetical protein